MDKHKPHGTRNLVARLQGELAAKQKALDVLLEQNETAVQRYTMLKEMTYILKLRLHWIADGDVLEDEVTRGLLEQLELAEQQSAVTSSSPDSRAENGQDSQRTPELFKYFHVAHYLHTATHAEAAAQWQLGDILACYRRVQREIAFQLLQLPSKARQAGGSPEAGALYQQCSQAIALQYLEIATVLHHMHKYNKREELQTFITLNLSTMVIDPQPVQVQVSILNRMQLTEQQCKVISTGVKVIQSLMQPLTAARQALTQEMDSLAEEARRVQQAAIADSVNQKQLATLLSQQEELAQKCAVWARKEAGMCDCIFWLVIGQLSWRQIGLAVVHSHPYVFRPMLLGMEIERQWQKQQLAGQQQKQTSSGTNQHLQNPP